MDQIGKFDILDKIGSGGFAVVYKGWDPHIKRPVAIKVCFSRDEETRERFHREAEVAGRLEHKNITRIFDFGFHDQMPYLVEEYLSGEDLAHLIRRGEPTSIFDKVEILHQIAAGLEHAHSQGVVHRDVKPSNIRILDNGQVKIMDFGTAKLTNVESNLTQTGMTLGTVAYLSPQRLLGQDRGSAMSDIFSFGVLGYELISGQRPFPGRNIPSLIDQVLNSAPLPLLEQCSGCPPQLAEVIERCLLKETEARYPSCSTILHDLEDARLASSSSIHVLPPDDSGVTARAELQALSLLQRAKKQLARGRDQRAIFLLEEVLEIDPGNSEARSLLEEHGASTAAESGAVFQPEEPGERRARKIGEAWESIEGYVAHRELGQAAAALKFALQMLGTFDEAKALRTRILETLRIDVLALSSKSRRRAREIAERMSNLHEEGRLTIDFAEIMASWVAELDPHIDIPGKILGQLRSLSRGHEEQLANQKQARKQAEAVASIEKLLAEGHPDMAAKALQFAVRLLGEFEQIPALELRIADARRHAER